MPLGDNPSLVGEAWREGTNHQVERIFSNESLAATFPPYNVTKNTALVRLIVICRRVHLTQHQFRYHGHRYQLRMNVFESCSRLGALILVNKDVTKSFVVSKIHNARTIGPKDCFKLTFTEQSHIGYMMWAFYDDFVRTDTAADIVILPNSIKFLNSIRLEGGIFVRHDADGPVGEAEQVALVTENQDLRRSHVLISRAEGTLGII